MLNENDVIYDFYKNVKLTVKELRQFDEFKHLSDEELEKILDEIFDLAVTVQKIIQDYE